MEVERAAEVMVAETEAAEKVGGVAVVGMGGAREAVEREVAMVVVAKAV